MYIRVSDKYNPKLSHGNDNDCASFSRLFLELVMVQKYNDATKATQKNVDVKDINY